MRVYSLRNSRRIPLLQMKVSVRFNNLALGSRPSQLAQDSIKYARFTRGDDTPSGEISEQVNMDHYKFPVKAKLR